MTNHIQGYYSVGWIHEMTVSDIAEDFEYQHNYLLQSWCWSIVHIAEQRHSFFLQCWERTDVLDGVLLL